MVKRLEVDVEDLIALAEEMRQGVPAGLAGSSGEDDAFAGHFLVSLVVDRVFRRLATLTPATGNS
jgi:hypothetical protein